MLFLETLGAPVAWKKVRLGLESVFLGFHVELREHKYTNTPEKQKELKDLATQISNADDARPVPIKAIRTYTHKAAWAVQVTEPLRPFLQPFFSFIHATKDLNDRKGVTPPALLRFVNRYLYTHWSTTAPSTGEFRRSIRRFRLHHARAFSCFHALPLLWATVPTRMRSLSQLTRTRFLTTLPISSSKSSKNHLLKPPRGVYQTH